MLILNKAELFVLLFMCIQNKPYFISVLLGKILKQLLKVFQQNLFQTNFYRSYFLKQNAIFDTPSPYFRLVSL